MPNETSALLFEDLDDLLETERDALMSGDLEKVSRLLERKENLLESLSRLEEFETERLKKLTQKLQRNQDLLDSALTGIRAIATRLATLRRVRETLDTYDATGTRRSVEMTKPNSLEKRA